MILTEGLAKRYGAVAAVAGIDLHVRRGEIYGFLGPNGAGKTSTILMLLGAVEPTAGGIRLFGERYVRGRMDLRRRLGVVPEKHPRGVWPWMTAAEYLRLFADLFGVPRAAERIDFLLAKVDLAGVRGRKVRELSHGMLQKLSFVRAMLHDPDLLLLDEPTSGLDPIGIKQVRDLIVSENREGRTILISSHQLSEMERICDRVGIICRGRLLVEDTMGNLLARVAGGRVIHVELDAVPPGTAEAVRALPFVRAVEARDRTLLVTVGGEEEARRLLSEALIGRGLVPLGIAEKLPTLEEAFVTITQENVGRLAREGTP